MKSSRVIIGVVLVFVFGILCGGLATHLVYKHRFESILSGRGQAREDSIVSRLDRKLGLDKQQEQQVRTIIHETQKEIKTLRNQFRPQSEVIIENAQAKISTILTPEQRRKFEQIIADRKERMRKKGL